MKAVLGALLLMVLLSAGCVFSGSFSSNYGAFVHALERNGASEQTVLPPSLEQLRGLKLELLALEASIQKQTESDDQKAVLALIGIEHALVQMQENYFLGAEQSQLTNFAFLSCAPQSNIKRAESFFDKARSHAAQAEQKITVFLADYPGYANQIAIDLESLKQNAGQSKSLMQSFTEQAAQFCA